MCPKGQRVPVLIKDTDALLGGAGLLLFLCFATFASFVDEETDDEGCEGNENVTDDGAVFLYGSHNGFFTIHTWYFGHPISQNSQDYIPCSSTKGGIEQEAA